MLVSLFRAPRGVRLAKHVCCAWRLWLQHQKSVASRGDMPMERMQELADVLSSLEGEAMQGARQIWHSQVLLLPDAFKS